MSGAISEPTYARPRDDESSGPGKRQPRPWHLIAEVGNSYPDPNPVPVAFRMLCGKEFAAETVESQTERPVGDVCATCTTRGRRRFGMAPDDAPGDHQAEIQTGLVEWADRRGILIESVPIATQEMLTVNLRDGRSPTQTLVLAWSSWEPEVSLLMVGLPGSAHSQRWARRRTVIDKLASVLDAMWQRRAVYLRSR
jgi:hypothetical protein